MTLWQGTLVSIGGNVLFQIVMLEDYRRSKGFWPWQNAEAGTTIRSYGFSAIVRIIAAGSVGAFFIETNQITGPLAAALTGIAADQIVKTTGLRAIKEVQHETE